MDIHLLPAMSFLSIRRHAPPSDFGKSVGAQQEIGGHSQRMAFDFREKRNLEVVKNGLDARKQEEFLMNFKKNWKRFWTLSRASEGFTLVELIVVIAIMAILAGVAVPAYSGYIKKAEKAGDLQLLGAVNSAFAAACVEQGGNPRQLTHASAAIVSGKISTVTATATTGRLSIGESFNKYFAGNEASSFKVITALDFDAANGVFVESGEAGISSEALSAAVDAYNKSNMAGKAEDLAGSVENLSNILTGRLDPDADGIGLLRTYMGADYENFLATYGISEDDYDPAEVANASVMYVASKMEGATSESIMELMEYDIANIPKVMETYGTIPTYALMYGVATGYANSEYASTSFKETYAKTPTGLGDVDALITAMGADPNFATYLEAPEKGVAADMDGYLGAMEVVNGYEGNLDLSNPDLFTDEDTMNLLNSILGSSK